MEKGLMEEESMEKLGFTYNNSMENEIDKSKRLFQKYALLAEESKESILKITSNQEETKYDA